MGKLILFRSAAALVLTLMMVTACDDDDGNGSGDVELTNADREALAFMLEEEKLARDTYQFLYEKWDHVIFLNIGNSEQTHMDAVTNLMEYYDMTYTILAPGEFENRELQDLYDELVAKGESGIPEAVTVGATIEDLDIVDLQDFIDDTDNKAIEDVFSRLQCGSRNHLRSFTANLESLGENYSPQYLTEAAYEEIINTSREQCGF